MSLFSAVLLFAGGLLAGVINVMAGGAGFMTFPLLIAAGMSEMQANASNFVAVLPANVVGTYVYRHEMIRGGLHIPLRLVLAGIGAVTGSLLLVWLGETYFHAAIPWLLTVATLCFALGPLVRKWLERAHAFDAGKWLWLSFVLEFIVYVYGGYFGLGMGIILYAIYSIFSHMDIHQSNAVRNVTITLMTLISIVIFATTGLVQWLPSLIMMAGATTGGYGMVNIARKFPPLLVRRAIIVWAILLTAYSFWRYG